MLYLCFVYMLPHNENVMKRLGIEAVEATLKRGRLRLWEHGRREIKDMVEKSVQSYKLQETIGEAKESWKR
jgi:hypothetical protein